MESPVGRLPKIVSVTMSAGDGTAEDVAAYWRGEGYRVRVDTRRVRSHGAVVEVLVVTLVGRQ